MLNTIHSHHNSFCMDDFLRGIWFIFESIALIIFLFYFFYTDCRYPDVIICSINTILSYYVHSSFKKKEKKRKGKKKILAHQCLGDDKEKIWREFSSSFPSFRSERYRAVMKLKYFYHKTLKAQPRNDAILWKKEKVLRVWCQYKPHIQC